MSAAEIRSKHADSHRGQVINANPESMGLRYWMNSAALRFLPSDELAKDGYGKYVQLYVI